MCFKCLCVRVNIRESFKMLFFLPRASVSLFFLYFPSSNCPRKEEKEEKVQSCSSSKPYCFEWVLKRSFFFLSTPAVLVRLVLGVIAACLSLILVYLPQWSREHPLLLSLPHRIRRVKNAINTRKKKRKALRVRQTQCDTLAISRFEAST